MALTPREKEFIIKLKNEGVSKEDALGRLGASRERLKARTPLDPTLDPAGSIPLTPEEITEFPPQPLVDVQPKAEPFVRRSEELGTRAKEQIGAGEVGKGVLSGIGAGFSKAGEALVESVAGLGTTIGLKIEEMKGTIDKDQSDQLFIDIVSDPEFFNADEQKKADIVNVASSFLVPVAGAAKVAKITNPLLKAAGFGALGVGATAAGTVQTEGRLPTAGETAFAAGTGSILGSGPAVLKKLFPGKSVDDIVGTILQGKTKDIKKGAEALKNIDVKGVNTFKELKGSLKTKEKILVSQKEKILSTNPKLTKIDDLAESKIILPSKGDPGSIIKQNFVEDAFTDLKKFNKKDLDASARLIELENKAKNVGLSTKEIDGLAVEWNNTFGSKAFSKTGEPLTSVTAKTAETIRKGLKTTARKITGEKSVLQRETIEALDKEIGNLISTKKVVDKMVEKTNMLSQKVKKRKLLEKLSGNAAKVINSILGGAPRGFLTGVLQSNIGDKVQNSLHLQEALSKNLKLLEKATNAKTNKGILDGIESFIKANPQIIKAINANVPEEVQQDQE